MRYNRHLTSHRAHRVLREPKLIKKVVQMLSDKESAQKFREDPLKYKTSKLIRVLKGPSPVPIFIGPAPRDSF